ncbi:MAG TPA: hypothetical protein VMZ03_12130 [Chitinophagaceae bacterium]|nr:hypothetical protein [Chitinophagaceae bacterium]
MFKNFICLYILINALSLPGENSYAQTGVDMGYGHCALHGGPYKGASCPKCTQAASSTALPSNTDFRLDLVKSTLPLIMELFKKDPRKQQEQYEAQQRELERIAAENERQRQIKEAIALELHNRLMALYKKLPDYQQVTAKTLPGGNNNLGPKTFDGDKGDYMYKGVNVNGPATNSFTDPNLSPQDIQTLIDPDSDPIIVDLRNAHELIVKNLKTDSERISLLPLPAPNANGEPIFQKQDCNELKNKLGGYLKNQADLKKTIDLTREQLNEWKEKNNKALWNAAEGGATFLFGKFFEHLAESRKNANNIKEWLVHFEKPMKAKGIDVDSYINLLDTKIINYTLTNWTNSFSRSMDWAIAVRDGSQSLAEYFTKTNTQVAAILNDPAVKLFLNEGDSKIEAGTFGISEATAKSLNNALLLAKTAANFLTIVNPVASLTQFSIDQIYNATDWILSYRLILQQNSVHDKETQAAQFLHQKITETFETMKNCK